MRDYHYSLFIFYLTYFLSSLKFIELYTSQSIYWLPLGFSLIINFINVSFKYKKISRFLRSSYIPYKLYISISIISLLILLLSSFTKLLEIAFNLPLSDQAVLLMPTIFIFLLFLGPIIGITYKLLLELR